MIQIYDLGLIGVGAGIVWSLIKNKKDLSKTLLIVFLALLLIKSLVGN